MKNKSNYALSRKLSLSSPLDVLHWEAACLSQSRQQINYFDTTLVTNTHIYAHKTQFQGFLCVYTQTNKLLIGSERVWCIPRITLFEAENRIFFFFFIHEDRKKMYAISDYRFETQKFFICIGEMLQAVQSVESLSGSIGSGRESIEKLNLTKAMWKMPFLRAACVFNEGKRTKTETAFYH